MTDEEVIDVIKISGLRGRGGQVSQHGLSGMQQDKTKAEQKYIVCNADEGDPGAFMDRAVLEGRPIHFLKG